MKIFHKTPLPADHPNSKRMVKEVQEDFPGIKYGDKCPCGLCRTKLFCYELSNYEYELVLEGRARVVPVLGN